jgi:enoyl-CoA hydratase/carnithine racemase
MAGDTLLLTLDGAVATLTLNVAARRNAISAAMWRAIPERLGEAEARGARVLIVTGAGAAFAAGADISEFAEVYATAQSSAAYTDAVQTANAALAGFPHPVIAMVRGACVGGGCGIALACDLRFADPTARFGITPAKLGLAYTLEDTKRLTDAVGFARAKDILFSGRLLDAEEALSAGLIQRVIAAEALEAETRAYAAALLQNAPGSIGTMKRIVGLIGEGYARETQESAALYAEAFASADFREGYAAFMEKRKPRFS